LNFEFRYRSINHEEVVALTEALLREAGIPDENAPSFRKRAQIRASKPDLTGIYCEERSIMMITLMSVQISGTSFFAKGRCLFLVHLIRPMRISGVIGYVPQDIRLRMA